MSSAFGILQKWRRIFSVKTFSQQPAYLKKTEMFLPFSLKTSLLTVRQSKPLLWCRQLEWKVWCRMQMWALHQKNNKKNPTRKKQFLSFSCEDRSSVFLLWAKTLTSVSTYGTSEKSRFVNLTETMAGEWRTKIICWLESGLYILCIVTVHECLCVYM